MFSNKKGEEVNFCYAVATNTLGAGKPGPIDSAAGDWCMAKGVRERICPSGHSSNRSAFKSRIPPKNAISPRSQSSWQEQSPSAAPVNRSQGGTHVEDPLLIKSPPNLSRFAFIRADFEILDSPLRFSLKPGLFSLRPDRFL
ncbi:hypothetical protein CDAR_250891 [Caerostris darwini]|uniref:Uncharacterized protein n=1 Tax=Caerostris darwini TaxID=1538125 RepID=A0AAV4TRP2_9ARAC|nr:hypothetical protein CDAR_250891 [Caerostris darwini]